MLIVAFYLALQPGSEDNCSRCAQLGPAEVCLCHANLHCHGFAVIAVTAESELGQCPAGMDVPGVQDVPDVQGCICENKQALMRK